MIVLGNIFPEKVKEYYGDGSRFDVRISYVCQPRPKGIAHAISLCKSFVCNEKFIVYLGDNILEGSIEKYAKKFISKDYEAMILLTRVNNPSNFGIAQLDINGRLIKLVEKPKDPPSNYGLIGIYFLSPKIFGFIDDLKPSLHRELEVTDALQSLVSKGFNVGYDFVKDWWKDIGTPEDLIDANRYVLDKLELGLKRTLDGFPSHGERIFVDEGSVVEQGASIREPSVIGRGSRIETGVCIGPYTSIGNNVIVKRGKIENSIVMDHSVVDVEEKVVGSIISPDCQVLRITKSKTEGKELLSG